MADWSHADGLHVRSAEGWLDLGMPAEARAELEQVTPELRNDAIILMVQWRVEAAEKNWPAALQAAQKLVDTAPDNAFGWIHRSYALHELKQTQQAWDVLFPALEKFNDEELIPYNLACYACQLGRLDEAKSLIQLAMKRGDAGDIKARALEDADLLPLRTFIRELKK